MKHEEIDILLENLINYFEQNDTNTSKYNLPLFHMLYLFSNEELNKYFPKIIRKNASVLTVGSSGDQILYSLLYGAKDVTCFDVNPFTKFYNSVFHF